MCGIAGYFGPKKIDPTIVQSALALMKRRGPDTQNWAHHKFKEKKNAYLLHSRLSILDLDPRSDQPFYYKNKVIILNGEIYNYLEVKECLIKLGHVFETTSDTEVLIHALEQWGWDALNIIEGMWAFALYDIEKGTLTLSRDPFGEKPLYYYRPENGEHYFGSEIKFLAGLSKQKFTVNMDQISRFMVNGYKSLYKQHGEGFFKEVHTVPRASVLEIDAHGREKIWNYWQLGELKPQEMNFEEAVAGVRARVMRSVELRLRSDVPIAFCMSGGVDSNTLISIAKRVFNYDVHGFTILNKDKRYEEQDMIDVGVKELNIKHTGLPIDPSNFIEKFRELIFYHDAPVFTITFYLNWLLQEQIAKSGYRISISGTAADELFSGYFDHQLIYLHDIKDNQALLEHSINNWQKYTKPIVRNPELQDPHAFINRPFRRTHAYLNCEKYASYLHRSWSEPFSEVYFREGLLQNRMMNELFHETTPISLHEDDLNAMYYSIENRAPFLDRELFTYAHSIPVKHLIKDGTAKAVLREAMRGIVPDSILNNRRKVGFNAPITDLLQTDRPEIKSYLLDDSPIFEFIKKESIKELIQCAEHPNSDSKFLFSFLSSKLFLEQFL